MKKLEIWVLLLILAGGFLVRLYQFHRPVADWHSWRQVDTSSVSRNLVKYGYDIFLPRFDDLSKGVSLIDNPEGYRFVEFPFYNILQAGLFQIFGKFTIEEWGRLVAIFSSLIATIFLYLLVKRKISIRAGLIAACFYLFVPYNIYYGRTLLPDSFMVMAFLGGLYFFDEWIDNSSKFEVQSSRLSGEAISRFARQFKIKNYLFFILSIIFTATALLIKPFVAFFFLAFLYLVFTRYGLGGFKKPQIIAFFIFAILPFVLWRVWMQQYPEGIPRSNWLYNGNGIRFKPIFYWWIFAERISRMILGYWGLPFVVLGLLLKPGNREKWLFFTFIASTAFYLHVFATGNVQHDYYQILIVPTLAIFFAKGVDGALSLAKNSIHYLTTITVIGVSIVFMLMFGWYVIRDFYNLQHVEVIEAGKAVDALVPKDAKVIAPYGGDTTFLYHTKRRGWPVFDRSLKEFRKSGATHIAFVRPGKDELHFAELFKTVKIEKNYGIFDLTSPTPEGLKELNKKEK